MKKVLSLLLACALMLSIAGCSPEKKAAEQKQEKVEVEEQKIAQEKKPDAEKKKISFWTLQLDKDRTAVAEAAVERFKKDNPDVEVEVVTTESTPYKTKLKVALGAGDPPDVFHSWGGGWLEAFVNEGAVLDITEYLEKDDWKKNYIESYLNMSKYNDKYYGVPYEISSTFVWYNKDLFKKYSVEIPKTWEEFKKAVKTFKDNGIIPIALGNKNKWPGALTFLYLSDRIGGPEVFVNASTRKSDFGFEDPTYIEAGKKIQELVDMGAYPQGMNGINYDTGGSRALMYTEKAAMIIQTTGFKSTSKSEAPDFYTNKLDFFPFPVVEGGKGDPSNLVGGVNVYSISSKAKYKAEAVELLKYISDRTTAQERADKLAILSAVPNLKVQEPMLQKMAQLMSESKHTQNYYDQALPPELGELHKDTTQALFGKTMTPEEAAKKMEEKAKEVFGK